MFQSTITEIKDLYTVTQVKMLLSNHGPVRSPRINPAETLCKGIVIGKVNKIFPLFKEMGEASVKQPILSMLVNNLDEEDSRKYRFLFGGKLAEDLSEHTLKEGDVIAIKNPKTTNGCGLTSFYLGARNGFVWYWKNEFAGVSVESVENQIPVAPKTSFVPCDEDVFVERRSPKAPSYVQKILNEESSAEKDIREAFKCQNSLFHHQLNKFLTDFKKNSPDNGGAIQDKLASILARGLSDLTKTLTEAANGCCCERPCCQKTETKNRAVDNRRNSVRYELKDPNRPVSLGNSSDARSGEKGSGGSLEANRGVSDRGSDDDSPIFRTRGRLKRPLYGNRIRFPSESDESVKEDPPKANEDPPLALRRKDFDDLCLSPSYSPLRKRRRDSQDTPPCTETQSITMDVVVPIETNQADIGVQASLVRDLRDEGVQVTKETTETSTQTDIQLLDASTQFEDEICESETQPLQIDVVMTSLQPEVVDGGTQTICESISGNYTLVRGGTPKKLKTSGAQVPGDSPLEEDTPEPGPWVESIKVHKEGQDKMEETMIVLVRKTQSNEGSLSFATVSPPVTRPDSSSSPSFASADKGDDWGSPKADQISEDDSMSSGSSKKNNTIRKNVLSTKETFESRIESWILETGNIIIRGPNENTKWNEEQGAVRLNRLAELQRTHKKVYLLFPVDYVEIKPEVIDSTVYGLVVGLCRRCFKITPFSQVMRTDKNNTYCPLCLLDGRKQQPVDITYWFRLVLHDGKVSHEIVVTGNEAEKLIGVGPQHFVKSRKDALLSWSKLRREIESRKYFIASLISKSNKYSYLKLETPQDGEVIDVYDTDSRLVNPGKCW